MIDKNSNTNSDSKTEIKVNEEQLAETHSMSKDDIYMAKI